MMTEAIKKDWTKIIKLPTERSCSTSANKRCVYKGLVLCKGNREKVWVSAAATILALPNCSALHTQLRDWKVIQELCNWLEFN